MRGGAAAIIVAMLGFASATQPPKSIVFEATPTKNGTVALGAQCLDGSPFGMYVAKGDPDRFVVYLEGGGICQAKVDCVKRLSSGQGSSKFWPKTQAGIASKFEDTIISGDAAQNARFASWTRVFLTYCSGDVWAGQRVLADAKASWGLSFAGHRNLQVRRIT